MAKTRIAVIGLGLAVTPHARALVDLSETVEVAYAFSPTQARRAAFAKDFDFPLTDSLDAILADDTVDACLVLTPPNTHLDITRACAAAGKHVLLEKPLEISTARANELVRCCREAEVTLGVVFQFRFRPAAERLGAILESGALGRITGCSTYCRLWRPQSYYDEPGRGDRDRDGGGALITQAIHSLDLMLSLAGPISEVSAFAQTSAVHDMETEDMGAAAVRYANGAIGVIDATTAAYPGFAERIEFICAHGTASLSGTELAVRYLNGESESLAADGSAGGTGADPMAFPHHYHQAVIADFLDAIAERRSPRISGEEALKVHRLIDAILRSAASGKRVDLT